MSGDEINVSIKEYFERLIHEHEKSSDRALQILTDEMHRRLDILNGEDKDRKELLAKCLTRDEYAIRHEQLTNVIMDLKLTRAKAEGQASRAANIAWIAIVISSLFGIVDLALRLTVR